MAIVREGSQSVLIVVDMQVDVIASAWKAREVSQKVAGVVEKAHLKGVPVIWVQHAEGWLKSGSPGWQIVPELAPAQGDIRIEKEYNSAFEQTGLEQALNMLKAAHIVLAGAATNWCIRATAHAALERGYDLTLVRDGHTTEPAALDDGTIIEAETIIQELNYAIDGLSYPGRKNRTLLAAEIEF